MGWVRDLCDVHYGYSPRVAHPTVSSSHVFGITTPEGLAASTIRSAGSVISFLHLSSRGCQTQWARFCSPSSFKGYLIHLYPRMSVCRLRDATHTLSDGVSLYKTALLRALYRTMFHGFLRVGEATSKSPHPYSTVIFHLTSREQW